MVRFVLRCVSLIAFAIGVVAATFDSIASVSASQVVLTPLGIAWMDMVPTSLHWLRSAMETYLGAQAWAVFQAKVLAQPTFAVALTTALLLWILGYKRPRNTFTTGTY